MSGYIVEVWEQETGNADGEPRVLESIVGFGWLLIECDWHLINNYRTICNLLNQETEQLEGQKANLQETVKMLTAQIEVLEAWKKSESHYRQLRVAELDKRTETINSLTAENDKLSKWGLEAVERSEKLWLENKLLRQQLGSEPTTGDSLNMEFRHNPNDDYLNQVSEGNQAPKCSICNAQENVIVAVNWQGGNETIIACEECLDNTLND